MVKRDGAFTRSQRIKDIQTFILDLRKPERLSKLLALFQMKHGLTREKVREYLDIIVELHSITIDEERDLIIPLEDDENETSEKCI